MTKKSKIEAYIVELQQLSIDCGHEKSSDWFTKFASYGEKVSIKRWCMRNRFTNDVAAHAIQQIRGIKL